MNQGATQRVQLQPAYVLHQRPYRDTSRIVDLFTRDHGRMTVFARGVRGGKAGLAAALQAFQPILVSWSGKGEAGQLNALETLNIRGERSVTCKGDFDRAPSAGSLPAGAPAVCEEFRKQPDALERAAELDKQFGRNPDLDKLPMYGVVFSFKDPFDTRDMRSTGGGDAAYDIDFPARDHVLVEQLRNKGAIIFAKAVNTEYNGRAGDPRLKSCRRIGA